MVTPGAILCHDNMGVETKRVNEAVRNNPDKFPSGYSFELNVRELRGLRTKISSTNISTKTGIETFFKVP